MNREEQPRGMTGGEFLFDFYNENDKPIWGQGSQSLWTRGEGTILTGTQGVGKSLLAQQLTLALIGIRPPELLGFPVQPLRPSWQVLYLAMDRPRQIQRSFRRMVTETDRKVLDKRLVFWRGPLSHLNLVRNPYSLVTWIEEEHPKVGVIVADSYKDLASGLSNDDVGSAINIAVQEVIARGREWLGVHHTRKAQVGNKTPRTLDDVYGSTFLTAGLGSVIGLGGEPGAISVELRHLKSPSDVVGPLDILHDHRNGTSRAADAALEVIDVLSQANDGGVTLDEVALAVYYSNTAADKQRARRQLEKLVNEGVAQYSPGGKGGRGGGGSPARWSLVSSVN
jgi:replicative DNA helicase